MITIPEEKTVAIQAHIASIEKHVKTLEIKNDTDYESASALLIKLASSMKKVKAFEKDLIGGLAEELKKTKNKFKILRQPYADAEVIVRGLLNKYINEKNAKAARIAAQLKKNQEAERKAAQKAAEALAKEQGVKVEEVTVKQPEMLAVPEPEHKVQTEEGAIHTRKVKKWKVTAKSKIPRKFWVLDEKLINATMKTGEIIEGIEYYEESVVAARA
jgi:hypothetical protein